MPNPPKRGGFAVACTSCGINQIADDDFDQDGLTPGEVLDHIRRMVKGTRWQIGVQNHEAYVVCPQCVAAQPRLAGGVTFLPFFRRDIRCPKCDAENLAIKWRSGRDIGALATFEHIERTCVCGYSFAQGTLSQTREDHEPDGSEIGAGPCGAD